MKNRLIYLFICTFINCYTINSQLINNVDNWVDYLKEMASETENEEQIEALYADLSYLSDHPYDLNSVTFEQLKRFPFLSDVQIENILNQRLYYGKIVSIYELKNIESLDLQTIFLLLPFVYIGDKTVDKREMSFDNMLKYSSNELQIRYDQCFQQKYGYRTFCDSILQRYPNRKYLGEPFYHSIRYAYEFDERVQVGLSAEKDAGEPFWNQSHRGYDYYSCYVLLKDVNKWLKTAVVGDYKISFGQGLVVSNDFVLSRTATVTNGERRNYGFKRHYSTNENDYFRGAATTIAIDKMNVSLFYSHKKLDASIDNTEIRSLKTDGLHRLQREREKMNLVPMQAFGGNIRYVSSDLCFGVTALSYSFGRFEMQPDPKPYNLFYFRGNNNTDISVDYLLKNRYIKFYGETALSSNMAVATLNGLQITPVSYCTFLLIQRYYDRSYQSFYGRSFGQNSTVQNEQGIYLGMQCTPMAHWKLSAYADIFRFPWIKYGTDSPTEGKEWMIQTDYSLGRSVSFYIRYRQKQKEKYQQQRLRYQLLVGVNEFLQLKTSLDGTHNNTLGDQSKGFMVAQSFAWKPFLKFFQSDLYVAFFCTDDYNSRITSYEKNILYAFNMPSFYGRGVRVALSMRLDCFNKRLSFSTKYANTWYFDREKIGKDTEEIDGKRKSDLYALIRWKF